MIYKMDRKRFIELESKLDLQLNLEVEQLSCLKKIEKYYLGLDNVTKEKVSSMIMTAESLSKTSKFKLPLLVGGIMLPEGRHDTKFYPASELKKSTINPVNRKFPIIYDHKKTYNGVLVEVSGIIGKVDRIYYDDSVRAIRWEGHINDETAARNIYDGLIKQVSATILSYKDYDNQYGEIGVDLTYTELSLCVEGKAQGNSIEVR